MLASRLSRLPSLYLLLAIALITVFLYYHSSASSSSRPNFPVASYASGVATATNATLGFGGLWAVSGPGSPRRNHLEQAAAATGLELTIPTQPIWSDEDVDNFKWPNKSESQVTTGTAKAWLSHHVVLREFLNSGQETALIFEDDVDWDIRLKTIQVPLAQRAARSLGKSKSVDASVYPWGSPKDWDLLYLGHCGDYLNMLNRGVGVGHHHPADLEKLNHVLYEDPSMPNRTDLHPFTASFLTALTVPEQTRVLHHSVWPLCTFGYAITRYTAARLLEDLAPPKEDIHKHITAYDAAILTACRDNHILCYTLQPELFHHMEGESLIAGEEKDPVHRPPVDEAGLEQVKWRKETSNIGCGFWSGEFYHDGDQSKLAYVQNEVIAKGQCLKPKIEREGQ
ncbi:hypothetical protein Q7P37_011077 [Cladosporium fusiforme]